MPFSSSSCMVPVMASLPFLGAVYFWTYLRIWGCPIESIALLHRSWQSQGPSCGLDVQHLETAELSLSPLGDQFGSLRSSSIGEFREKEKNSCETLRSTYTRCLYDHLVKWEVGTRNKEAAGQRRLTLVMQSLMPFPTRSMGTRWRRSSEPQ